MSITTSEAIAILEGSFTEDYAIITGAVLICFDHAITFSQEVELFWGDCMANFVTNTVVFELIAIISEVYAVTGGDRRPVMLLALIIVLNVDSHMHPVLRFNFSTRCRYKVGNSQFSLCCSRHHHDPRNSLAQAIC
ncbi:uncharacterized protein LAESUDRAFT_213436 [Laetiporus sulphureus 93-53]|uniref:DUF6533 domain-containing protein n=1 Tax=Laetiporus sulphureus 93-53 TaxID=1314785 RepID=A0A165DW84_9APHY|nr:uncharacterized protein LAESUDRAFT_213436 [Laetiporus sulphureus 93-53]KZT05756.1 hypothetical protein LAESUDRAFT_213436 [Laetiporus sulphureus 93-53]